MATARAKGPRGADGIPLRYHDVLALGKARAALRLLEAIDHGDPAGVQQVVPG